jgi:hypothetical protein
MKSSIDHSGFVLSSNDDGIQVVDLRGENNVSVRAVGFEKGL